MTPEKERSSRTVCVKRPAWDLAGSDARGEVGDGDAGFFDAEAGAGAEPVLSEGGRGGEGGE